MAEFNKYMITHWCAVHPNFIRREDGSLAREQFETVAASGINLTLACYDVKTNCEVLALAHELGLKIMIEDHRIREAISNKEKRREILESVVTDYASYPALLGYHLMDEPNSADFASLTEVREILEELDPIHESYVNLFPNYASAQQLGNDSYREHVEQFIREFSPEILSYDHYHFMKGEQVETDDMGDGREDNIRKDACRKESRPGFFDNIEDVYEVCREYETPFMVIILVVEHGPYRYLNEADIRWEVFQSLAYGSKRISYFTYWTPGVGGGEGDEFWKWNGGMVTKAGEPTDHYYMIQRINRELSMMGDILLPYRTEAVFHIGEEPDTKIKYWSGSYGDITEMTATRLTAGFYEGGYLLLANKDYENEQIVGFKTDKRVMKLCKKCGVWKELTAENGEYKLRLAAGDGRLLRLI